MDTEDNSESDPSIARSNAQGNFERLRLGLSVRLVEKEDRLATELAATPGSPTKRLRFLYAAMAEIGEGVATFAACRAGCDSCCHYNVSVFPVEAKHIEDWAGVKRLPSPLPRRDFHGSPCPFLDNGRCSIYEFRPMACRMHFALTQTPYWCAPERCDSEQFPLVRFSSADEAFRAIIRSDGRGEPLDIRQWFGTASRAKR